MWLLIKTTYLEQYPSVNFEGESNVYKNSFTSVVKTFKNKQDALDYKDTLEIVSVTKKIPNKSFKGVYLIRKETYTYEVYNAKAYREIIKNPKDFFLKEEKRIAQVIYNEVGTGHSTYGKKYDTVTLDGSVGDTALINMEAEKVFEPKTNSKLVNYSQFNETYKRQLDTYAEILKREKVGK